MEHLLQANIVPNSSALHKWHQRHSCEEELQMIGGYFDDGKLCWIANDSVLTILQHSTHTTVAYKNFRTCLNEDVLWTIVSCKAYSSYLLVGLAATDGKGAICLFNHNVCKILKTIYIPHAISRMEVVLEEGGATTSSKPFASNLRWFFGVIAVGTLDGHLYLIDLRLDGMNLLKSSPPASVEVVPTVVRDIPDVRDKVVCRGAHLAFDLLEQCHENNDFHFIDPDDQIVKSYNVNDVTVTALHFEKRCTSLFVGLSFGQFLIFDLGKLNICFSSQIRDFDGAVTNFVFQEPENDPKHFCYLWVVQCALDEALIESALRGTMFQLIYEKKELQKQNSSMKSLYSNLESCNPRFQVGFDESLGLGPSIGTAKILQCCAIECYHPIGLVSGEDDYSSTPYSSVFVTSWVASRDDKQTVHLLLFDINGWYVAHMPSSCSGFVDDEIYVALWSLNPCIKEEDGDILAICCPSSSFHHFYTKIHPTPRQFTQPSSHSLEANCLTTSKMLTCKMTGVQEQVIEHLLTAQCGVLVNPTHVFDRMVLVGLMEQCGGDMLTVDQKREAILSSALNHDIFAFFSCIISGLATGEYVASGCTLRMVLEWAWKQTALIKDSIDNLCIPIFDCTAVTLDDTSQQLLSRHITQLNNLHLIFKKLRQAASLTQLSELELDVKDNVITLIQGYLTILRWFIEARLLPEQLDDHVSFELETYEEFHFVYKQRELRRAFEERRSELKELNKSPEASLLIIDGLLGEAGPELLSQWRKIDGSDSANYPPPSLYALLSMYYLDGINTSLKHSIITYFLLDVLAVLEASNDNVRNSSIYEASHNEHRDVVSFFPQTFQLPLALTKLIQAFWLLDHRSFEESCCVFCEAGTERVTSPWQHRRILQAFMMQDQAEYALQYLVAQKPNTFSTDDVKLHIDVLVTNGKLHHALRTAQMKTDSRNEEVIYSHLFAACYKQGKLNDLLKITITSSEELMVSKYLESSGIPHAHDMLVLHHLRRARYVDAIRLYQKNKKSEIMVKHDELEKGYASTLSHLIRGYMSCLPEPIRDSALLNLQPTQRSIALRKEVPFVQPLSVILNSKKDTAPLSHAELLAMNIARVKEITPQLPMTPFRKRPGLQKTFSTSSDLNQSKRYFSTDIQTSETKSARRSFTRSSFVRPPIDSADESPMLRRSMTSSIIMTDEMNKKRSSLKASASILLQSPLIQRNRKPLGGSSNLDMMTPQSILKVKMLSGKSSFLSNVSSKSATGHSLSSSSTNMTSLKQDRLPEKIEFRDDGLDSSGSECETPAWMMPSMVSQSKEKNPFLSRFTISTPVVPHPVKSRITAADSDAESLNERPSAKKLRFRDLLVQSEDSEEIIPESTLIHLPPLSNVIVEETDEKQEVDVISDVNDDDINTNVTPLPKRRSKKTDQTDEPKSGDLLLTETAVESTLKKDDIEESGDVIAIQDDKAQESVSISTPEASFQTPTLSVQVAMRESEIVSSEVAPILAEPETESTDQELPLLTSAEFEGFQLPVSAETKEPASSETESITLRLSSSSDHFSDADSHVSEEKMSAGDEPLEISDEEDAGLISDPIAPSSILVPSQRAKLDQDDQNVTKSETPTDQIVAESTQETILPSTEAAFLPSTEATILPSAEAAFLPSTEATILPSAEAAFLPSTEATILPSAEATILPSTEATILPSAEAAFLPSTEAAVDRNEVDMEKDQLTQQQLEDSAPAESVIGADIFFNQLTSVENEEAEILTSSQEVSSDEVEITQSRMSSSIPPPSDNQITETLLISATSRSEAVTEEEKVLEPLSEAPSLVETALLDSSPAAAPKTELALHIPSEPASMLTEPQVLPESERATAMNTTTEQNLSQTLPQTLPASEMIPIMEKTEDQTPPVCIGNLGSEETHREEPSTESIAMSLPSTSSAIALSSSDDSKPDDVLHFDREIRKSTRKKETPRRDPTFILSPPLTRSRTKPAQPKSALKKSPSKSPNKKKTRFVLPSFDFGASPPSFVFSPPSTVRTRSQRKRKLQSASDVTVSKTPRTQSPPKTPVSSTNTKTPTRSSRRLNAKKDAKESAAQTPTVLRSAKKSPEVANAPSQILGLKKTASESTALSKARSKSPELAKGFEKSVVTPSKSPKVEKFVKKSSAATETAIKSSDGTKSATKSVAALQVSTRSSQHTKTVPKFQEWLKTSPNTPLVLKSATKSAELLQVSPGSSRRTKTVPKSPGRLKTPTRPASSSLILKSITKSMRSAPKTSETAKSARKKFPEKTKTPATPAKSKTPKTKPTVEQSARKSARKTKASSSTETKKKPESEALPSVAKSGSRTRSKKDLTSSSKRQSKNNSVIVPSPSKGPITPPEVLSPSPSVPVVTTRSSSRRTRSVFRSISESEEESTIATAASISRRTRSSSASSDDVPMVTQTSSRRKRARKTPDDPPSTETRSSRKKSTSAPGSDQPSVSTTRLRSKSKNKSSVTDLSDIIEEVEASTSKSQNKPKALFKGRPKIFGKVHEDFSKDPRCPSNHPIKLINISPASSQSSLTAISTAVSTRTTRSGKVILPVTSRRRAKVFLWDRKERTYKKK